MTETDPVRRAAARHRRGHRLHPAAGEAATSAARSPCWSTAAPRWTRSRYGESAKSETIRKMIIAMSQDIRVLVIKLADRLHNMRTLHYLRPDKQSRIASETLEIFAPLAHRLGMNAIKWELEDLAFGTLHPKVYDEIVRMVAEAAPSRDEFLSRVIEQVQADLRVGEDQGRGDRPTEALLLDLPEDDRPRPRLHRHLRPGRAARPGREQPRLLRRPRRAARPLEPAARPVQGLHRDAEVQHVPVAAHHGARARGQAGRAADPHRRDAPAGRVRRRRALEVQGGQGRPAARQGRRRRRRPGLGPPAAGLAAGDRRSRRVPGLAAVRDQLHRGLRLHPEGRGRLAAAGLDADRLRVRDPHRGGPQDHRRPGQRPAGAARVGPGQRRRGGDLHVQGAERGTEPRLADASSRARGPGTRSGTTSPGSAARSRSRTAGRRWPGRCARPGCRCSGC